MKSSSEAYKNAGVDITAGYKSVELMKKHIESTLVPGVISEIGGFGGLFSLKDAGISNMTDPVLVSGTDGVGTKLRLAFKLDKHDTIGIDCVAMCVNDIICKGAKPLFFLDYIGTGKISPEKMAEIVSGIATGCEMSGAGLIGGETAEMPGSYPADEYDLAGFSVGIVDRADIIDGRDMREGDKIIALKSSGFHSNGYSLVRKIFDTENSDLKEHVDELGCSLGEALLEPTKIYVKPVLALISALKSHAGVKGIANITGGGFYENIPRAIPKDKKLLARIDKKSIRVLPVFEMAARFSKISERDMLNTFNMGVGMVVIVAKEDAKLALEVLEAQGEEAYVIGETVSAGGDDRIEIV